MATATTEKFEEMVLEVEFDPSGAPGVYSKICGLTDISVTRTATVDSVEIPDCADESLPLSIERQVRSIEVSVSATGTWAQESWGKLADWFYSSTTLNARIQNAKAASGDTEYESGPCLLTSLPQSRTKGQKVQIGGLELQFDGTPTRADAA